MTRGDTLRIGNAGGYWGDDPEALQRQVEGGGLHYVTMDFLAEITMSILQKQRSRDPSHGYARDFLLMLRQVLARSVADGVRIITNAGGVNPEECARQIDLLGKELGIPVKVAVVFGDDILPDIDKLIHQGAVFLNMETGESFDQVKDRLEAANVYFGAEGVVEALKTGAHVVVTGRVTDTGITLAAMIHEFNWSLNDWNKLAAGIVAGHIIECGSQSTGGNFTDWHKVPSFDRIGYPIIEMEADGTFVVTKHPGSGGLVSIDTVREQLFYEMGDPRSYITPDVVADFSTIRLEPAGPDRVRVSGIQGREPTPFFKVSMAYRDGYKAQGSIMISGPHARAKAEKFASIFWSRAGKDFTNTLTEYVGHDACHRSLGHQIDGNEILLRLSARSTTKEALTRFGKRIPSLILGGPPGVAVIGGVPKVQDVVSYWPALIDKKLISGSVALFEAGSLRVTKILDRPITGNFKSAAANADDRALRADLPIAELLPDLLNPAHTPLAAIALARSGDKGDMCNIGVLARSKEAYEFLCEYLTAQRVKNWFQELCLGEVMRFRLDHLQGLNFTLDRSLGGGGTLTLRTDAQGKTFSQALLRQRVAIPSFVLNSVQDVHS